MSEDDKTKLTEDCNKLEILILILLFNSLLFIRSQTISNFFRHSVS